MAAVKATGKGDPVGVTLTVQGRYRADFKHRGASIFAGAWDTPAEAGLARDRAILHFGLEGERGLNYPARARRFGSASPEQLRREARLALLRSKGSETPYFGVERRGSDWTARLKINHIKHYLGRFDDVLEAARAYDRAARYHLGEDAPLNFPGEALEPRSIEDIRAQVRSQRKAQYTSQYRGVFWDASREQWGVQARYDGSHHYLGRFDDEQEAARAYDYVAWQKLGEKAQLNFPSPPKEAPRRYDKAARRYHGKKAKLNFADD